MRAAKQRAPGRKGNENRCWPQDNAGPVGREMKEDMNINDKQFRAQVLIEALPYIQDYNGKTVVIKYGGNAMINERLKHSVMRDIVLLRLIGVRVVLVHGGGPEISEMLKRLGKQSVFVDGLIFWKASAARRWACAASTGTCSSAAKRAKSSAMWAGSPISTPRSSPTP